jgi:hypothetical protein
MEMVRARRFNPGCRSRDCFRITDGMTMKKVRVTDVRYGAPNLDWYVLKKGELTQVMCVTKGNDPKTSFGLWNRVNGSYRSWGEAIEAAQREGIYIG